MFFVIISISFGIFAQAPERMSHQVVIRNAGGAIVKNQVVGMQISILQGSATGTPVYVETHTPTTNANGLATIEIGGGTIVYGTFAGIDWAIGAYFIKTETDPAGGTSYTISGTSQLMSVPYALYAGKAGPKGNNVGDMQYWNGACWVLVQVGQPGQLLRLQPPGIPEWSGPAYATLTTKNVLSTIGPTAKSGGVIINDGGETITARGICWSTSPNPTIANDKTTEDEGLIDFDLYLTGLTSLTQYYVRAYATNSLGTMYGNEISFVTGPGIGDSYQGGIIAYFLQSLDSGFDPDVPHGLIVAPSDQVTFSGYLGDGSGIQWYNGSNITTNATGQQIGTGNANTNLIVAAQSEGSYAAKLCYDLELNGYSDWFLPSIGELAMISSYSYTIINYTERYWSSTESGAYPTQAYSLILNNNYCSYWGQCGGDVIGGSNRLPKSYAFGVRAIRAF